MKLADIIGFDIDAKSLPARGARIEITERLARVPDGCVAPRKGSAD